MPLFSKKPVVIEAHQIKTHEDISSIFKWITENGGKTWEGKQDDGTWFLMIKTLEGDHRANIGDFVIKGVRGEFYPCKPDIFEITYQPVDKDTPLTG